MSDRHALTEIGPYRIEGRLGAGGMGEVYRAHDARLDRSVAVKLIRPESSADQTARERFRREARAAAALTHPSIVRIYDVVASGEGEAIVMELVEGELLSQRIARGPLPVDEAVRLGRQIAEGLAAAHRRGILHRDLKAENVIITPDGEAKIMDFGLAKRLDGEPEGSLTRSDAVIGTFRAMSPEQARGMALDQRSDLFSFGVLLYEMLTGVSPFRTGSAPDTLMRICTARQVPVRELRPEVTEGVSNLVDHLLEKESAFRPPVETVLERLGRALPPHMSSTVKELIDEPTAFPDPALLGHARLSRRALLKLSIAILALMTLIIFRPGLGGLVGRYGRAEPLYLAVPKSTLTEHSTDDERATLLAGALRLALLQGATRIEGIVALSPDQVDPVKGDPKVIARATAASEVLVSELDCGAESCRRVELRRVLGSDGRLLWARSFEAPLDNPYVLVEAVGGYLEQAYSDRPMVAKTFIGARPEDFAKYLQLRQQYDVEQWRNPPPEFLGALAAIRRSSPRFLEANLFEAEILLYRFGSSHDAEDLRRTSLILQEARELAPFDSRPLALAFNLEMTRGELSRAAEALKQLELQQPGSTATMIRRAQLLERQGRIDEAVGWMRDAVRRHPSWRNLAVAAEMEYRLGRFASSRHYLEDLLARFPEHQLGLSMLGQIELSVGSPERAVEIYAEIANRSPQPGVLVNLGLAHMLLGNYGQAAEFLQQAARLETKNPVIMLDLGDAHFLNGKSTEAGEDYKRVLFLVDQGTSKSDWQNHSVRAQALAHLGQRREAVAAVQELLRMAPNNAQASYEASLVYVLVGDEASALFNAERALELGVEPRWFRFPWFDPLRRTKFRDRLMLAESRRNV